MGENFWLAECPECHWTGKSTDCAGGGSIADTGDFDDVICPVCYQGGLDVPVIDVD